MGMYNLSAPIKETESEVTEGALDTTKGVVDSADTATDQVIAGTTPEGKPDAQQQTIVLDGPLSQIYTQALNIAYAKESVGMMFGSVYDKKQQNKTNDEDGDGLDDSYVYAVDADDLDTDCLLLSAEALRVATQSGRYRQVILAIESHGTVTKKMQLLTEMSDALGAKVCLSRNSAIQSVMTPLKKG